METAPSETTPSGTTSSGTTSSETWPKRVTLMTKLAASENGGVRLADGTIVTSGGDLTLYQAMVLSISTPTADSLCEKGTFDALSDVPTTIDACPASLSGTWEQRAYLSAATTHGSDQSYVIGLGILVRNPDHTAMYRLRVVGDSYDSGGVSTATFDYEPVP
ncbi:MAG: hypothetical protein QM820_28395 [Minicystis sp.]